MEALALRDERLEKQINRFKARIYSYVGSLRNFESVRGYFDLYLPYIESLLRSDKDNSHLCLITEHFNQDGIPDAPAAAGVVEIIREVFNIEPISRIPAQGEGYVDFNAYRTNTPRIFVTHSFLRKQNGSSSAWSFERIDQGTEGQYQWLPKDYDFATS